MPQRSLSVWTKVRFVATALLMLALSLIAIINMGGFWGWIIGLSLGAYSARVAWVFVFGAPASEEASDEVLSAVDIVDAATSFID